MSGNFEIGSSQSSLIINAKNLIHDELHMATCMPNGVIWTYNQGVILGALCDISIFTGDKKYRQLAESIGDAVLKSALVTSDGILTEFNEQELRFYGQDGFQFKGIFMRNLVYLSKHGTSGRYNHFIETNARSVLRSRNGFNQYGKSWSARAYKDDHPDFARQTSAIDCLNAALTVLGPTWMV
jgi:predicted alpha-1,6-mannanase (GH76 family)